MLFKSIFCFSRNFLIHAKGGYQKLEEEEEEEEEKGE